MQTRRPHPIGEHLALLLQATMNPLKLSSKHLVLNWLSERGEYSKAARSASLRKQDSALRALSIFYFLFSIFYFLISLFYLCNSTMVIAFPPCSSVSNECFSTNGCEARNSPIPLRSAPVPCP